MANDKLKIDIATVFSGKKAFSDAAKSTIGLNNQVKTLAQSYLGLFTAQRLARNSFIAVKAFAADDKAAKVLGKTLNNLGLGFGNNAEAVNNYISGLEKQTGVLDDELRPAMDRLLRATGDITKSQQLLSLALDISAGTGKTVTQVSQSLQKAYLGQTQALGRLGVGLSKAELASSSFEEIQARLSTLFAGQASQAADTYSGSLDKLAVASNNAKEAIGRGLVDALSVIGGGGQSGFENIIKLVDRASLGIETLIRRIGVGVAQAKALLSGNFSGFMAIGKAELNRGQGVSGITPAVSAELKKAAAEKAATKRAKEIAALTSKNTKAIKDQTAILKAGTLFDLEQTGVIAALKGKITEEERTRLELQLAILSGNTKEATKLSQEIAMAQDATGKLALYLRTLPDAKNPFASWQSYLDSLKMPAFINPAAVAATTGTNAGTDVSPIAASMPAITGSINARADSAGNIVVNVGGSVISESDLIDLIEGGLQGKSLSGSRSAIGRLKGQFGT